MFYQLNLKGFSKSIKEWEEYLNSMIFSAKNFVEKKYQKKKTFMFECCNLIDHME
jgi:hypothetical protein